MTPTNSDRANTAANVMQVYAQWKDGETVSLVIGDTDALVTDLLTDLRHFCAVYGVDFDSSVRMSENHFEAEVEEAEESNG